MTGQRLGIIASPAVDAVSLGRRSQFVGTYATRVDTLPAIAANRIAAAHAITANEIKGARDRRLSQITASVPKTTAGIER